MKIIILRKTMTLLALILLTQLGAEATIPRSVRIRQQKGNRILVVVTTATLADIAHYIGGRRVYVTPLSEGYPPESEPKAEYRSVTDALKEAHVLIRLGKAYDPWIEGLIAAAANSAVAPGRSGHVDTSTGIAGSTISECGHASYYWLDPENGKKIASSILIGLESASPRDAEYFRRNYGEFVRKLDERMSKWQMTLAPYKGTRIVSCCDVLSPFEKRFGLAGVVLPEPLCAPGTPATQVSRTVGKISSSGPLGVLTADPCCPADGIRAVAETSRAPLLNLPASVKSRRGIRDYFELFDRLTDSIAEALS